MQEYIRKLIFRFATGGGNCDPVVGQVKKYQEERMTTKSMTVTQRDMKRSQGGFTLIEIIAVLVILGILAAVAVPRFIDLQEEARLKALDGAFSAGASQLAMEYARTLMAAEDFDGKADDTGVQLGDFEVTLSYGCGSDGSSVTVTGVPSDWPGGWLDAQDLDALTKNFTICEDSD